MYVNILSYTWTEDLVVLFNTVVLGDSTIPIAIWPKTINNCSNIAWEIIYWTLDWTDMW